jgi:hypothetical protein
VYFGFQQAAGSAAPILLSAAFAGFFASSLRKRHNISSAMLAALPSALPLGRALGLSLHARHWPWAALLSIGCGVLGWATHWSITRWTHPSFDTYLTSSGTVVTVGNAPRTPVLAAFWLGFSIVAGLSVVSGFSWRLYVAGSIRFADPSVSGGGLVFVSFREWQRRSAKSATELLRQDQRSPVVYLRPFRDDGFPMARSTWRRELFLLQALTGDTREQVLARTAREVGPFIALGRPGETLPELGASRLYVAEDDWRLVVQDLLSRAALVIVQAGDTPSLRWELGEVVGHVRPDASLLFLPRPLSTEKARQNWYAAFACWAEPLMPDVLPTAIPDEAFFLYFLSCPPWKAVPLVQGGVDTHPLDAVLKRLALDPAFRLPPTSAQTMRAILWLALGLLPIAALGVWAYCHQ